MKRRPIDEQNEKDTRDTLKEISKTLNALLELLTDHRRPVEKEPNSPSENNTYEQRGNPPPVGALLRTVTEFDNRFVSKYNCDQEKSYRLQKRILRVQWLLVVVTAGAVGAATWYASIARDQRITMDNTFREVEKQTQLTRQEFEGTEAAVIEFQANLGSGIDVTDSIAFLVLNRGHVNAIGVHTYGKFVREQLPSRKALGNPVSFDFKDGIIQQNSGKTHSYTVPGFSETERERTKHFEETIAVTGEVVYQNGFGDIIHEPICMAFLPSGAAFGFSKCGDIDSILHRALEAIAEQKRQLVQPKTGQPK